MNEPHKLEYAPVTNRYGHSAFGIASVCLAIAVLIFVVATSFFEISPFDSLGNQKETLVSCIAALLGILLAVRALADPSRKRILGIVGMCLNAFAGLAAMTFLPCL